MPVVSPFRLCTPPSAERQLFHHDIHFAQGRGGGICKISQSKLEVLKGNGIKVLMKHIKISTASHLGVEPRAFGLEVQRAIHCANGTLDRMQLKDCENKM